MRYSLYQETKGVPPLGTKTLTLKGSVAGEFAPATFEGWNRFFGPTGWTQNNNYVFYTKEILANNLVIEVEGKKYNITSGYKGRIRNVYFLVSYV